MKAKKQFGFTFIVVILVGILTHSTGWSFSEKRLTARAAFLMNATTGEVLFQRQPDRPLPPASTTKVMTALVALEKAELKDRMAATETASQVTRLKLGLRPGQTMSVEDLLYSTLLYSANDASMVLAEGIGSSVGGFAEMMTQRAKEIGAQNSQFKNPHGLTAIGHYSSARDLALIFNRAMENQDFRNIVQTKWKWVNLYTTKNSNRVKKLPVRNKNRLLWNFKGAVGGKTGYTRAAKRCFVGSATRNGVTLIVSILGSRSLWRDARSLLEYGFNEPSEQRGSVPPSESYEKSDDQYMVQIGSFQDQERAESFRSKISKGGFDVFVQKAFLIDGPTAYRVRVGPYSRWNQANRAARKLERKRGLNTVIFLSPSPSSPSDSP